MDVQAKEDVVWPLWQKVLFRFFFVYILLFILADNNHIFSRFVPFYAFLLRHLQALAGWVNSSFFHQKQPLSFVYSGSGDMLAHYLYLFIFTITGVFSTVIWSLLDNKRSNYIKLLYCLRVAIRYYVGITLIIYGNAKLFKTQFHEPNVHRLNETFGEASPMGLAWTFFGYSTAYNYFMGAAEVMGGMLLLFKRTTTLGALISLTVAVNIMAVTYCFDVPVKILSTALVVMCLFILAKDLDRFINFFILNREVRPASLSPFTFKSKTLSLTTKIFKYVFLGYLICTYTLSAAHRAIQDKNTQHVNLLGYYTVSSIKLNGKSLQRNSSNLLQWRKVVISNDSVRISLEGDKHLIYAYNINIDDNKLIWFAIGAQEPTCVFVYKQTNKYDLLIQGKFDNQYISVNLQHKNRVVTPLMSRNFHWVSDTPYNR